MNTQEIIDKARNLPFGEQQRLLRALQENLERQKDEAASQDEEMRRRRLEWLKAHREEYAGQYVALDGDRLVGEGATIREAREEALQNGVANPFLVRLESENTVLPAGL